MNKNRGSEWRKWDLHIHTPLSICQQYGGDKEDVWEKFICSLENLPVEVKVIGITDYYFIDGYQKVMQYKQKGRLKNIEKIFPILEFRIDTFGSGSENKLQKINLHILFDVDENNLDNEIKNIQEEFIDNIKITSLEAHKTKKISKENFINIAGNLQDGFNSLIPSTKEVFDLISSKTWKHKTFLFLGYKEWGNLDKNNQLKPFKEDLYSKVNAFFSNNAYNNTNNQKWLNEFGNKKLLHSLDIHNFTDLDTYKFDENGNKKEIVNYHCFTWIKADPTFEGLKQIIYEPEERVKIQENKPDEKEDKEIIDKVRFISPNNIFTNEEIHLNPNLNVIIGGKSSGKSILLYSIAKTLLPDIKDKLLFRNDGTERYNLKSIDKDFDFEITTKGGISQKISDRDNGDNSVIPTIKYIPQNELVKLAEPELSGRGESLNKLVRNLICEDEESKQKYNDTFIKNVKGYDKNREDLIDNYFNTLDEITKLEEELKTKSNKEVLETNIKTNSDKVEELNKKAGLTPEKIKQYRIIQGKQLQNQQKRDLLKKDYSQTNTFLQELKNELLNLQTRKNTFLENIQADKFREYYKTKLNFIDESIVQLEDLIKEIELTQNDKGNNVFVKDNIFNNELNQISSEKQNIENEMKPYQQNEEIQKQIKVLNESIANDKKLLSEIETLNKQIKEKKERLPEQKNAIFELYEKSYEEYISIVESLKGRTQELENDGLQIKGIAQFNFQKFRDNVLDFTDGRSSSNSKYDILKYEKTRITNIEYSDLITEIRKIFEDILSGQYVVNTRYNYRQIMKKLLDDYFYDYWEITYKNDKLGEMSTGKASFVILMLIVGLSQSKSPILIDQPEDNLDNRSVSENIIEYLRNKKVERQIILVTHNANIVVNADSENVIVANQKGQNNKESTSPYKFDYINGAIENTFAKIETQTDLLKSMGIKEHIADIVEGGQEAFKNREKKYGFV